MQKRSSAFTNSGSTEPHPVNSISSDNSALRLIPGAAPARPTELPSLSVSDLEVHGRSWIDDCQYRLFSSQTIVFRRSTIEKLVWFLGQRGCTRCGQTELRHFLTYVARGHDEPGGRWGNAKPCM